MMTLAQVEEAIYNLYQWFHKQGGVEVYPQESGYLGQLWSLFDQLIEEEA